MNNTATLLRALRKYHGLYQATFADYLQTTQGTLSKLESGQLELSANQWVSICIKFNLDPNCLLTGIIESVDTPKLDLVSANKVGNFKIPKKYSYLMGSTVRTATPLLNYYASKKGIEKRDELIKSLGFDPDYFVIQSNPLSIKFVEEITLELMRSSIMNKDNYLDILSTNENLDVHKYSISQLKMSKSPEQNFKNFTKKIKDFYEINSNYTYEGDSSCLIRVEDNEHMSEINLDEDFKEFRKMFNLGHFNKVKELFTLPTHLDLIANSKGWDIVTAS